VSEDSDLWKDHYARSKAKRAANRESSPRFLTSRGVKYEVHNQGFHLVVEGNIDFWPGTGLWRVRNSGKQGRGVQNLANWIQRTQPRADESDLGCALPHSDNPFKDIK
jgi:hypothetical protein